MNYMKSKDFLSEQVFLSKEIQPAQECVRVFSTADTSTEYIS